MTQFIKVKCRVLLINTTVEFTNNGQLVIDLYSKIHLIGLKWITSKTAKFSKMF